jgi:hypothetical protein
MSNENTTSEPATNGTSNGAPNVMPNGDAAVSTQHKEDETAPHKKKTRSRRDRAVAVPTTASSPPVEPAITPPQEPGEAPPAEAVAALPKEPGEVLAAEVVAPTPQELEDSSPQKAAEAAAAPQGSAATAEDLRLRVKVWTDHWTGKRYLMPSAFMRDVVNGRPVSDVMVAYAMRDDDTRIVTMRAHEWNTLPFFYFTEDGPAPRATARPIDVIGGHRP